jgi:hypothetical protein
MIDVTSYGFRVEARLPQTEVAKVIIDKALLKSLIEDAGLKCYSIDCYMYHNGDLNATFVVKSGPDRKVKFDITFNSDESTEDSVIVKSGLRMSSWNIPDEDVNDVAKAKSAIVMMLKTAFDKAKARQDIEYRRINEANTLIKEMSKFKYILNGLEFEPKRARGNSTVNLVPVNFDKTKACAILRIGRAWSSDHEHTKFFVRTARYNPAWAPTKLQQGDKSHHANAPSLLLRAGTRLSTANVESMIKQVNNQLFRLMKKYNMTEADQPLVKVDPK